MSSSDSVGSNQPETLSLQQVKRAENIQIVVATGVISAYIALLSRDFLPTGVLRIGLEIFVVSSLVFLVLKLTFITVTTYTSNISNTDLPSYIPRFFWIVLERAPSLRTVDRIILPFLYIFSFWGTLISLLPILIPDQATTEISIAISGLVGSTVGNAADLFLPLLYLGLAILGLIPPAIRYTLGYKTAMTEIETASTGGTILLTSGGAGSEAEIQLRNPSEDEAVDADDIRIRIDSPDWIEVTVENTIPVDEDENERKPTHGLPPNGLMNLSIIFRSASSGSRSTSQVKISTIFKNQIEQIETYSIEA